MRKTISHLAIVAGAMGLAISPIAAQANTRAGASPVIYTAPTSTTSDPWIILDDEPGGAWLDGRIFGIVLGVLALGGLVAVTGDNDDQGPGGRPPGNQSPGAN